MHPIAVLVALKTYAQGRGMKGSGKWSPVTRVIDALDKAFYLSFDNAPTTGKRIWPPCECPESCKSTAC